MLGPFVAHIALVAAVDVVARLVAVVGAKISGSRISFERIRKERKSLKTPFTVNIESRVI